MSAVASDLAWHDRAACRGVDQRTMFPGPGDAHHLAIARALCADCPVRVECLADAKRTEHSAWAVHGVRGGLSAGQRIAIKRGRGTLAALKAYYPDAYAAAEAARLTHLEGAA